MTLALKEAREALTHEDVPVGAVVVKDGALVAAGHNRREIENDPTAHAELVAIRTAALQLGTWRLDACTLYVTLEPCIQCAGSILLSRISRVVYATTDPKGGAMGSLYDLHQDSRLNHQCEIDVGIHQDEAASLLRSFFQARR